MSARYAHKVGPPCCQKYVAQSLTHGKSGHVRGSHYSRPVRRYELNGKIALRRSNESGRRTALRTGLICRPLGGEAYGSKETGWCCKAVKVNVRVIVDANKVMLA